MAEAGDNTRSELTPFSSLDETLTEFAEMSKAALQENFVGLYLLGSLAIGDFDLTSDVDFVIVIQDELTARQRRLVQAHHSKVMCRDSRWVTRLEYSFFPLPKLRNLSSPYGAHGLRNVSADRKLWYFCHGGSTVESSDHDNTVVTRWTLRHRSPAVLGIDPATFAPQVLADELRQEIQRSILGWETIVAEDPSLHNRFHQVFLVLNSCRALQDLDEGRITSKREGVAWAKQHLDARWHPLIDYCWLERQDTGIHISQPADPHAWQQTLAFIDHTTRYAENFRP